MMYDDVMKHTMCTMNIPLANIQGEGHHLSNRTNRPLNKTFHCTKGARLLAFLQILHNCHHNRACHDTPDEKLMKVWDGECV